MTGRCCDEPHVRPSPKRTQALTPMLMVAEENEVRLPPVTCGGVVARLRRVVGKERGAASHKAQPGRASEHPAGPCSTPVEPRPQSFTPPHQRAGVGGAGQFLAKLAINMQPATYVEWGSGGTTNWITPLARRSFSVEHEMQFCRYGGWSQRSLP